MRRRLDDELVRRGLVASRAEAQRALEEGLVTVAGRPAGKASTLVAPQEAVHVEGRRRGFVSRGGEKLVAGLDRFGVDPSGRDCLDVGASTGGFTDCLLRRGAARVAAVDVGYGQLAWSLRRDARVVVLERTNARSLRGDDLPFVPDLVAADLSFVSLCLVLPAVVPIAGPGADLLLLVKPQFEVAAGEVGPGGVVRDSRIRHSAIGRVVEAAGASGAGALGVMASPLLGPAGNVEFLLHAREGAPGGELDLEAALQEGAALEAGVRGGA